MKKKYTEKQLIEFGNYLLSQERKNRFKILSSKNLKERLSAVHHADICNYIDESKIKEEEGKG